MDRPANGLPEDLREHARLMCDIIAIAFQTNKTRVASLIISRDLSAMYYPFLDVKEGHHAASHDNNSDGYERISRFHVEPVRLSGVQAGQHAGRRRHRARQFLPDVPSNMWIGRKHDNSRLPLVLAGGLGGTLETGRTLNYLDAGEDNRKMCSLYLSLMDRFGSEAGAVRRRPNAARPAVTPGILRSLTRRREACPRRHESVRKVEASPRRYRQGWSIAVKTQASATSPAGHGGDQLHLSHRRTGRAGPFASGAKIPSNALLRIPMRYD